MQLSPGYIESGGKMRLGDASGYEFRQVLSWQDQPDRKDNVFLIRAADLEGKNEYKIEAVQKVNRNRNLPFALLTVRSLQKCSTVPNFFYSSLPPAPPTLPPSPTAPTSACPRTWTTPSGGCRQCTTTSRPASSTRGGTSARGSRSGTGGTR